MHEPRSLQGSPDTVLKMMGHDTKHCPHVDHVAIFAETFHEVAQRGLSNYVTILHLATFKSAVKFYPPMQNCTIDSLTNMERIPKWLR